MGPEYIFPNNPLSQGIIQGGDLYGHMGEEYEEFDHVHGDFVAIVNTYCIKNPNTSLSTKVSNKLDKINKLYLPKDKISAI